MRAKGFDIHTYSGEVNFSVAKNAGLEFSLVRAGGGYINTGTPFKDNQFDRNKVESPKYLKTGYWWYFAPVNKWVEQAEMFRDLIKDQVMHIRPIVDVEEWTFADGSKIPMSTLQARLKVMLDILEDEFGVKPIIYTRTSVWDPYYGNPSWAKDYPLWVARYPFTKPQTTDVLDLCQTLEPYTNTVGLPTPWNSNKPNGWVIWQCSADENKDGQKYGVPLPPYGTEAVDLNLANGSIEELLAKVGMGTPPPPPPSGDLVMKFINTGGNISNIRSSPVITTNIVGELPDGAIVTALEMRFINGYAWIRFKIDPAWLLPNKTASEGWAALVAIKGTQLIDFHSATPCSA